MAETKLNPNQITFINSLSYNCLIDPNFTVNQRNYVSNATLAAGVYGHDRWKAGASGGDYTFTQLAQATTITIKSGKSLIQVIEDKNVIGGTYTLSWTGTAQARFGIDSATPSGDYAASPITITGQTAGTVMSVEFNEGTLGQVNCANSSVALPFMPKSYHQELLDCKRYHQILTSGGTLPTFNGMSWDTAGTLIVTLPLSVSLRSTPTFSAYLRVIRTTASGSAEVEDVGSTTPSTITYAQNTNTVTLIWTGLNTTKIPVFSNFGVWGSPTLSAEL
jgi:hypothetical protein